MGFEEKLSSLLAQRSLELPAPPAAIGVYRPLVICGTMAYLSGHGPLLVDGTFTVGKVGADLDKQAGFDAAERTGLAMLATLQRELESLDSVRRLVKLVGMVNCTPDFTEPPAVVNGCSQLFADVFGQEYGIAARSAFGVASLPGGWPVEIEAIFEVVGE